MNRRRFLQAGLGAAVCGGMQALGGDQGYLQSEAMTAPPAFSVIPVVGDGKFIWTKPPQGQTGYLEPQPYSVNVGIELTGQGEGTQIRATTPLPIDCPEQKLEGGEVEIQGCEAEVRDVGEYARQLCLTAPQIAQGANDIREGQLHRRRSANSTTTISGAVPAKANRSPRPQQAVPRREPGHPDAEQGGPRFVGDLAGRLEAPLGPGARSSRPGFPHNIRPQIGPYTGVITALEKRQGDCAEMSAVFVALCRAAGIPARLVWVPNHNWAEMYLTDKGGKGHWIPVHTACYFWFGWTGAHELVIQKGDRLRMPDRGSRFFRLQEDWMQWGGRRPAVRYLAELTPQPAKTGEDPGPGARRKIAPASGSSSAIIRWIPTCGGKKLPSLALRVNMVLEPFSRLRTGESITVALLPFAPRKPHLSRSERQHLSMRRSLLASLESTTCSPRLFP